MIDWNTNTRHSTEAQIVIQILFSITTPEKILQLPNGQKCIESLLPYTGQCQHHFSFLFQEEIRFIFIRATYGSNRTTLSTSTLSRF